MKFKEYIDEEYLTQYNGLEIHKNPSLSQIRKLSRGTNQVRFFVDFKKKNIYVWFYNMTHSVCYEKLQEEFPGEFSGSYHDPRYYMGFGKFEGGVLAHQSDSYYYNQGTSPANKEDMIAKEKVLETLNDDWTKYYFGIKLSNQLKKSVAMIKKNPRKAHWDFLHVKDKVKDYDGNISEEYFASHYGTEVVVNPSKTQLRRMVNNSKYKRIRFAVDFKAEKIYVWDAAEWVHADMVRRGPLKSEFPDDYEDVPQFYMGNGRLKEDVILHSSDSFNFENSRMVELYLSKINDDWTKYYFGEKLSTQLLNSYQLLGNKMKPLYHHSVWRDKVIPGSVYDSDVMKNKAIK